MLQEGRGEDGLDFTFELFESCVGMSREDASHFITHHFGRDTDVQKMHDRTYTLFEEYLAADGEVHFRPGAKKAVEFSITGGLKWRWPLLTLRAG